MASIGGQHAELRFTLSVTRQKTGEVETYEMIGYEARGEGRPTQNETNDTPQEKDHGNNSQH